MSKDDNNFFKSIKSKFNLENKNPKQDFEFDIIINKPNKSYEVSCERKLFLWGLDNDNNPSFLVLYGQHDFKNRDELEDNVNYTEYAVFNGKDGHFPSFEAVSIIKSYDYKKRKYEKKMFYNKDINYAYGWYGGDKANDRELDNFKILPKGSDISLPYFGENSYQNYVNTIKSKKINFENFKLLDNPNELLNLSQDLIPYYNTVYNIFSNPNIYMRKKYLKELINSNPTKEIYNLFLKIGSNELISGLFLELAVQKNNIILNEAEEIINNKITWLNENYSRGLKRCARIYCLVFDDAKKQEEIDFIKINLPKIDLHLAKDINNNKIEQPQSGNIYKYYAEMRSFSKSAYKYDYEISKYVPVKNPNLFDESYYCDGLNFDVIKLKNTIQESEILGLYDVIAKIAYYIDAPRLKYYLIGSQKEKALNYLKKYLRRILDFYLKNDEDAFIESAKILFTSYTNLDFSDPYSQFYFVRHYLYNTLKIDYYSYDSWDEANYQPKNPFLDSEGRYELMPEFWDRHLDDVIYIICNSKIDIITKAFYYILKDSKDKLNDTPIENLINFIYSSFIPLSDLGIELIENKLKNINTFDNNLMISLLKCPNEKIFNIAIEYFKRVGGKFSADALIELLLSVNIENILYLIEDNINKFDSSEYIEFLYKFIENGNKFLEEDIVFSESFINILDSSLSKLNNSSRQEKLNLTSFIVNELKRPLEYHKFIIEIIEKMIFELSDIKDLVSNIDLESNNILPAKNALILSLLSCIKNNILPSDSQIIEILETGTSKMISTLVDIFSVNKDNLKNKFSTILIMLESNVISLNRLAKEVFESIDMSEQKKLHSMIIDSPDKKVYMYGLSKLDEYYNTVPEEFVLQMFEHSAPEIKEYISDKTKEVINNLGNGNKELFMYYVKTVLYLPNKISVGKSNVYKVIPDFIKKYNDKKQDIENILLDIGNSNIILDSERALVALAKIKKEAI